jgi:hypothetical protein
LKKSTIRVIALGFGLPPPPFPAVVEVVGLGCIVDALIEGNGYSLCGLFSLYIVIWAVFAKGDQYA